MFSFDFQFFRIFSCVFFLWFFFGKNFQFSCGYKCGRDILATTPKCLLNGHFNVPNGIRKFSNFFYLNQNQCVKMCLLSINMLQFSFFSLQFKNSQLLMSCNCQCKWFHYVHLCYGHLFCVIFQQSSQIDWNHSVLLLMNQIGMIIRLIVDDQWY